MELKYKDMIKALADIESERRIPESVVLDALKEAMVKAYKKDVFNEAAVKSTYKKDAAPVEKDNNLKEIDIVSEINTKKGTIDIYQRYEVVEEDDIVDDELQISVEDAQTYQEGAVVGDTVARKVEINGMSRGAASLARSIIRQKIREAEKTAVYDEYIDQLNEMVVGIVESVKDKFTLINLGKTVAMLPLGQAIPQERLVEGQRIRVVITDVQRETKGSQVLVSRADPMLVRRLFEKEVPEIFSGVVEIKAIAREAGERTKMAVMSHNEDVDPIGACIGQRGSRVQQIIEELHGEKIDIFQWNDDITMLVKNALAPAEVEAVLPGEDDKSLLVVVAEDQLSLAIGKKGKNARLAVKLTNRKIDIKTRAEIEESGKDYEAMVAEAEVRRAELLKKHEREEIARLEAESRAAEERRLAAAKALVEKKNAEAAAMPDEDVIPEEMMEVVSEKISEELAMESKSEPVEESAAVVEETIVNEVPAVEEAPVEEAVKEPEASEEAKAEAKKQHIKANLEEMASKNEYRSVFEKLASTTTHPKPVEKPKRKKRKSEEEEIKVNNKDLMAQIAKKVKTDIKPVYTEEELIEIEKQRQQEEESKYDIDYDEYEDYYKDEEDN